MSFLIKCGSYGVWRPSLKEEKKKGFFLLSFNFVNAVLLHSLRSQTGLYVPPRDPIFKFSFANLSLDSDTCHFALLILQVFVRNFFFFN